VLGAVSGGTGQWTSSNGTTALAAGAGGLLFLGPLLMILFRRKYPRVTAYAFTLVTDRYPPFRLAQ